MPTPAEHRALLFVAAVAALGVSARGFRALRAPEAPAADREALAHQIARVDSAITAGGRRAGQPKANPAKAVPPTPGLTRPTGSSRSPSGPSGPAELTDLDLAGIDRLERLPGIGPALAARIVADREAHGPFGSLAALQRVKGIGPALANRLQPHVTFSLPPRPTDAEYSARQGGRRP